MSRCRLGFVPPLGDDCHTPIAVSHPHSGYSTHNADATSKPGSICSLVPHAWLRLSRPPLPRKDSAFTHAHALDHLLSQNNLCSISCAKGKLRWDGMVTHAWIMHGSGSGEPCLMSNSAAQPPRVAWQTAYRQREQLVPRTWWAPGRSLALRALPLTHAGLAAEMGRSSDFDSRAQAGSEWPVPKTDVRIVFLVEFWV